MNAPALNNHLELLPDYTYHVYNRGNNRENLFIEERNYPFFLGLWNKYISPIGCTFAYALLKNHFHSLLRIKNEAEIIENLKDARGFKKPIRFEKLISQQFSNLFNAYAKSINKASGRTGSLFQERFRRKLIDNDAYFTEVIYYIHGNPQKHGFTNDFRKYPFSSYMPILSESPGFLKKQEVLNWFGGIELYKKYHENYRETLVDKKLFLENINDD